MSKNRLTIKRESTPTRCEICHQSDQFDPNTGQCQRCITVNAIIPPTNNATTPAFASTRSLSAAVAGIVALFSCIFFWRVSMFIAIMAVVLGSRELSSLRRSAAETPRDPQRVGEAFAYIGIYGGILAGLIGIAATIAACWLIQ